MKNKYDLYISIGEACSCSMALRNSKLQFYSYPLDWIFGSDIIERIKFFNTNFENFIDKKFLSKAFEVRSQSCTAYYNKANDITFNHDFKNDVPFDEMYEIVANKYKRRANRVINQIKNSNNVLFVYLQSPDNENIIPNEKLINAQKLLQSYFPESKTDLLYIFCKENIKIKNIIKQDISDNIRKLTLDYNMKNPEIPYAVNSKTLDMVFRHFSITEKHLTKENIIDKNAYKRKLFFRGKLFFNPIK